jgi:hypothetical protein
LTFLGTEPQVMPPHCLTNYAINKTLLKSKV